MKVVIQRVTAAAVCVEEQEIARIANGLVVFCGFALTDSAEKIHEMAEKIVNLRIFPDDSQKMHFSLRDIQGAVLVVSQFTLFADTSRGRRPYFGDAANPEVAERLYELFIFILQKTGLTIKQGTFGAYMQVDLRNDGPVTIILEN